MTSQNADFQDIFHGAEKIEIFGKLPIYLWAYIDAAHKLAENTEESEDYFGTIDILRKVLGILNSVADHLGNNELKSKLLRHAELLEQLVSGEISAGTFIKPFLADIEALESLAGPRRESPEHFMEALLLDKDIARAERIKTGRSADIIVNEDLLEEIEQFLTSQVLQEGISTVLIIDNAGTLIVNIGNKLDLDVVGLAAVAAANFAATEQIARLIGEKDFVLLFYKGHSESFHFCRVGTEYIIVTIFDNALSLGLLRLKIAEVAQALETKLPKRQG